MLIYLLALLDVKLALHLILLKDFKSWVIPLDTVKVILSKPDLAGENRYRPASGTLLSARAKSLDSKQVSLVKQVVIQQDLSLLNAENYTEQALLLDSSDEYAAYLALKAKLNESQLREFQYQLLLQRSQLNATYHNPLTEIPKSPIESHASMKVAVTGGYAADSSFGELQLRPAYHSLSDKQIGFPQGSQILFMDTKLRFDKSNNFDLEKFTALDIVSAFPRNAFIKTTAWEFMTGIENQNIGLGSSRNEKLVWDSYFGLGSAVGGQTWLLAGFMDLRSKYNPDFDNSYALGLAPHLRALVNLSSELTIETEYFHSEYLAGDEHTASRADLRLRWFPEANHSIDIYGSRVSEYEDFYTELGLSVSKYF
ncbi:MAG: hypothetical protein R3A13_05915 [Bdellovibrionota bacterium]